MTADGALYVGEVVHKRAQPRRHSLRYRVFSLLVDVDRLEVLDRRLKLFSFGRTNLVSLFAADFAGRDGQSIGDWARCKVRELGYPGPTTRVRMLAYPRVLGYAFNPVIIYFLDGEDGRLAVLLYEVHNTFGQSHVYMAAAGEGDTVRHETAKAFYVSPFNAVEGAYRFAVRPPGDSVFAGITLTTAEGVVLTAWFDGGRVPLTDWSLLKLSCQYPMMTLKVILAIHWEALRLWLKGVPLTLRQRRPKRIPTAASLEDRRVR